MSTAKKGEITYESDIRTDRETPLGAVLYAPSGKMIAVTAEQKSLCSSKVFCLR